AASSASAAWPPAGCGRPCVTRVVSRATTGRSSASAVATASEIRNRCLIARMLLDERAAPGVEPSLRLVTRGGEQTMGAPLLDREARRHDAVSQRRGEAVADEPPGQIATRERVAGAGGVDHALGPPGPCGGAARAAGE